MFLEFDSDNDFKRSYFEMLKSRMVHGSLELEGINSPMNDFNQSRQIYNQFQAINYIFNNHRNEFLGHFDFTTLLTKLIDLVTGGELSSFRTTDAIVQGSKVPRSKPSMIRNDLWYLIDDYNYNWTSFDGGITPITRRNKKFKWVLYSRRIREKAQIK